MTFVAIFLVNAALSFALSLVVAQLVGPEAFGRYAVALAVSVVLNTALFEWLRLSTTRFTPAEAEAGPGVRRTLDVAYAATSAAVILVAGLALASGPDLGLAPGLVAGATALGLSVGLFDYRTAEARARFLDRRYGALLLVRAALAFGLATGAAWLWREPALVLLGSALASVATLVLLRRGGSRGAGSFDRALLARFARYAVPLVAASAIYQLFPLLNRVVLAGRSGFEEAGYFSLAGEVAVRLFQNLGSALDLALFQLAVRAEERAGRGAGERRIGENLGIVAAIVLPSAAGLVAVWPHFEAVFVPAAFHGRLDRTILFLVPAFAAYALVQYGLNPVFQIRHRTGPVIIAALAGFGLDLGLLLTWPGGARAPDVAAVQLAGMGLSLVVVAGLGITAGARLPWRDIALSCLASGAMAGTIWPWRSGLPPLAGLGVQVAAGLAIYGGLALVLDLAGTRRALARLWSRQGSVRRESAPAANPER